MWSHYLVKFLSFGRRNCDLLKCSNFDNVTNPKKCFCTSGVQLLLKYRLEMKRIDTFERFACLIFFLNLNNSDKNCIEFGNYNSEKWQVIKKFDINNLDNKLIKKEREKNHIFSGEQTDMLSLVHYLKDHDMLQAIVFSFSSSSRFVIPALRKIRPYEKSMGAHFPHLIFFFSCKKV